MKKETKNFIFQLLFFTALLFLLIIGLISTSTVDQKNDCLEINYCNSIGYNYFYMDNSDIQFHYICYNNTENKKTFYVSEWNLNLKLYKEMYIGDVGKCINKETIKNG